MDGVLGPVIADLQVTAFTVADEGVPLVEAVIHGGASEQAFHHLASVGLQPGLEGLEQRQALFLPNPVALGSTQIPGDLLNHVQFPDVAQGHTGFQGWAFLAVGRRSPGRFDVLTSGVIPPSDPGQLVGCTDLPIAGVAIGLQDVWQTRHLPSGVGRQRELWLLASFRDLRS